MKFEWNGLFGAAAVIAAVAVVGTIAARTTNAIIDGVVQLLTSDESKSA